MIRYLIEIVKQVSEEKTDGHFTLMSFTTGWKAMFCTPDIDSGIGRKEIGALKAFKTPEEAIVYALYVYLAGGDK